MFAIICGGRDTHLRVDEIAFLDAFHQKNPIELVINGGSNGIDTDAKEWALSRGIDTVTFHANWKKYGKRAGPIRNQKMAQHLLLYQTEESCCCLIAFPGGIGTKNMIQVAQDYGFPIMRFPS